MNKNIYRWAIGTIVVPILVALLSIFGVQIKDALFPSPPPEMENRISDSFEKRLIILETKLNTLMEVLHVKPLLPSVTLPKGNQSSEATKFKHEIKVMNDSLYSGRKLYVGKRAWDWTIYIDSKPFILEKISCVTYQLHPTFTNPTKRICDRGQASKAFSYSTTGWGTFNVGVRIEFKDGSAFTTEHHLIFRE